MYSTALLLMFDFVSLGFYYRAVTFIHGINNSIYFLKGKSAVIRLTCSGNYWKNLFFRYMLIT